MHIDTYKTIHWCGLSVEQETYDKGVWELYIGLGYWHIQVDSTELYNSRMEASAAEVALLEEEERMCAEREQWIEENRHKPTQAEEAYEVYNRIFHVEVQS